MAKVKEQLSQKQSDDFLALDAEYSQLGKQYNELKAEYAHQVDLLETAIKRINATEESGREAVKEAAKLRDERDQLRESVNELVTQNNQQQAHIKHLEQTLQEGQAEGERIKERAQRYGTEMAASNAQLVAWKEAFELLVKSTFIN